MIDKFLGFVGSFPNEENTHGKFLGYTPDLQGCTWTFIEVKVQAYSLIGAPSRVPTELGACIILLNDS